VARKDTSLLTVDQAGRALGVSRATVYRMIKRGLLLTLRKNGRRWVPAHVLKSRQVVRREYKRIEDIPPLGRDHPIFKLIGKFRSGGKGPGSSDKHAILDEPDG
jgi:excisionase family DNA binding protein